MGIDLLTIILTAGITGLVTAAGSTWATVVALRVHIEYLRDGLHQNADDIRALNRRVDKIPHPKQEMCT